MSKRFLNLLPKHLFCDILYALRVEGTLYRKIEKTIIDWVRTGKKALLIDGTLQVGKT